MASEDKDKIWEYVLLRMSEWDRDKWVTMEPDPIMDQITLTAPNAVHMFQRMEIHFYPKRVRGLDWDSFAQTMRVAPWVAKAMYKREEPGSQEPEQIKTEGGGFKYL